MKNKYYTPEIEEFHVGFEYEYRLNDEDWEKKIYQQDSFLSVFADGEYSFEEINENSFRVKHLDRGDIESLGFKKSGLDNSVYLYFEKIRIMPHLDKTTIGLNFNEGNTHCLIFFAPDEHNIPAGINMFVGKIRNKSEFRKLMKQLNIN